MAHQAFYSFGTIAWSSALAQICKVPPKTAGSVDSNKQGTLQLPLSESPPLAVFNMLADIQHQKLQLADPIPK